MLLACGSMSAAAQRQINSKRVRNIDFFTKLCYTNSRMIQVQTKNETKSGPEGQSLNSRISNSAKRASLAQGAIDPVFCLSTADETERERES